MIMVCELNSKNSVNLFGFYITDLFHMLQCVKYLL
jgi:hypothetical protein